MAISVDMMKKVPVREQEPAVRAKNFEEVCLGYNDEEAMAEATRCLDCKNPRCVQGCPVSINIPAFIQEVKNDSINPNHYKQGKVECIDCIESATSNLTGFEGFCTGNAIKYLYRWKQKGGVTDLEKARWYLNRMLGEKSC